MNTTLESTRTRCPSAQMRLQPQQVRLAPCAINVVPSRSTEATLPHHRQVVRRPPRADLTTTAITPSFRRRRAGYAVDTLGLTAARAAPESASDLFASTLPITGRGAAQRRSGEQHTLRPSSTISVSTSGTAVAADYGHRHHALLAEERETHRKSLDRVWQQRQSAEAALVKLEAAHQQKHWEMRVDALCMAEALVRSELACAELEARLDAERGVHRLRPWCAAPAVTTTSPLAVAPPLASSPAQLSVPPDTLPLRVPPHLHEPALAQSEACAATTARLGETTVPGSPKARTGKKRLVSPSSRPTMGNACDDGSPLHSAVASPRRPVTGLVRDSDLLRHLQQAEARIRQLEKCVAQQGQQPQAPYTTVTNTLIILGEDEGEDWRGSLSGAC